MIVVGSYMYYLCSESKDADHKICSYNIFKTEVNAMLHINAKGF